VEAAVDEQVELDVDTTSEVICAAEGCENVAAWSLQQHCPARHTYPVCDACKIETEAALAQSARLLICDLCPDKPRLVKPYLTWRPL
jgi:hypothetical protein